MKTLIKKVIVCLTLLSLVNVSGTSQELSESMSTLMQICLDLSHGLKYYSDQNISDANELFRQFRMKNPIGALQADNINPDEVADNSVENVVFLPEFFDRLIENDEAYEMSISLKKRFERNFGNDRIVKGAKRKFSIYQKDFFIKAGESISFDVDCPASTFEIVAVAGPGGLFNMNVYDYARKEIHKDLEKEKTGDEKRLRHIEGKKDGRYKVTLENRVDGSYTIAVFCKL